MFVQPIKIIIISDNVVQILRKLHAVCRPFASLTHKCANTLSRISDPQKYDGFEPSFRTC